MKVEGRLMDKKNTCLEESAGKEFSLEESANSWSCRFLIFFVVDMVPGFVRPDNCVC